MSRREEPLTIPRENADLRTFVRKKRIRIWLQTLGWEVFWLAVFFYYHSRTDMTFDYRFSLVLSALLVAGLFLFGWIRMMVDRSYVGVIRQIVFRRVMNTDLLGNRGGKSVLAEQMLLWVEETNGHRHKIVIARKKNFDRYYHVGDQIVHHSGLPYPESNDGADRYLYVCSLCGGVELTDTDHCHGCGASLIKPPQSRYTKTEERFF
ncbi:MAG: hypothetical protein IJW99_01195 [Clostridia bacterium]|nr:hypothetical protein [Clostridia bacterium]